MKLNHLSLSVADVASTAAFFKKYFKFEETENKGNIIIALKGENDFILVLTTAKNAESPYPKDFHFGFLLKEEEEMIAIFEALKNDGYLDADAPSKIRNTYGFYMHIPGGVLMEVSCII